MAADPNRVILTGENPFIRLSAENGGTVTTNASYWRIITCPAGPGHVLYLKSELTENRWLIYSEQHRDGPLAAIDRAGHAQPGDRRHGDPGC